MPLPRRRVAPLAEAKQFCASGVDPDGFVRKFVNDKIGYGLFTTKQFQKENFLLEYRGEVACGQDSEDSSENCYEFLFQHNGVDYRIDASRKDSCLARYINDDAKQPNCRMKKILIDNYPHLCLFALENIDLDEEIRYDYGPGEFSWRKDNHREDETSNEDEAFCDPGIPSNSSRDGGSVDPAAGGFVVNEASCDPGIPSNSSRDGGSVDPVAGGFVVDEASCDPGIPSNSSRDGGSVDPAAGGFVVNEASCDPGIPSNCSRDDSTADYAAGGFIRDEASCDPGTLCHSSGDASPDDTAKGSVAESLDTFDNTATPVLFQLGQEVTDLVTWVNENNSDLDDPSRACKKYSVFSKTQEDADLHDPDFFVPESSDEAPKINIIPLPVRRRHGVQSNRRQYSLGNHLIPQYDSFYDSDVESDVEDSGSDFVPVSADESDVEDSGSDFVPVSADESDNEFALAARSTPVTRATKQITNSKQITDPSDKDHPDEDDSGMVYENEEVSESIADNEVSGTLTVANTSKGHHQTTNLGSPGQVPVVSSSTSLNTSDIEVLTTSNERGKRSWDKPQFCPFCLIPQKKLPRHLASIHKEELQVEQWLATKDNRERTKQLTIMRNYGNFLHNAKVLDEGKGTLIVVYRPSYKVNPTDYLPCTNCFGYFAQNDLWKHKCCQTVDVEVNDAEEPYQKKRKTGLRKASRMMLPTKPGVSQRTHQILSSLKSDNISRLVRSDRLITMFAEKLTKKHGHSKDQEGYIRQRLREVARMVLEYRLFTQHSNAMLADLICPEKFNEVIEATRRAAGFQEETNLYTTPSLALKIGHSLKSCAEILRGDALLSRDTVLEKDCKAVISLYNLNWEGEVSHHALRTLHEVKRNNPKLLPLTGDIVKLSRYLKNQVQERHKELQKTNKDVPKVWTKLAELLLTQIIVFNRKRPGEVSKMTLSDYSKCANGETCVVDGALSPLEKALCKVLWRVEIIGKRLRTVVVLFTAQMKEALDTLRKRRIDAGIDVNNVFLFSNQRGLAHIRGTDTLREHASKCKASNPEFLRATRLRKHIATVSQVMNLQDNELDLLAGFLGHDVRTHREFYRMPESTLQVAKLSKVLLKMEKGDVQGLAGKSLKDVELDPSEEYDTDEKSDDDSDPEPETSVPEKTKEPAETEAAQQQRKKQWTLAEKQAVVRHLGSFLRSRKVPGKGPISALMKAEPRLFTDRSWRNVKDFVRNQVRKKDQFSFLKNL